MSTYSNYSLNMNKRLISIDEDKFSNTLDYYNNIIDNSLDKSERIIASIYKSLILAEYEDFQDAKQNKTIVKKRKFKVGPMLEDSFSTLITNNVVTFSKGVDPRYLLTFNFSEHLEIVLPLAFNLNYNETLNKLQEIAEKKKLSLKCLSLILMESTQPIKEGLTLRDLCSISSKIYDFVLGLIKAKAEENKPMIDSFSSYRFSDCLDVPEEFELTFAFRLKLRMALQRIIEILVVRFYDYRGANRGIPLSQFMTGVSFSSDTAEINSDDFYNVFISDTSVALPCTVTELY